jgi:hypothetical protein
LSSSTKEINACITPVRVDSLSSLPYLNQNKRISDEQVFNGLQQDTHALDDLNVPRINRFSSAAQNKDMFLMFDPIWVIDIYSRYKYTQQ